MLYFNVTAAVTECPRTDSLSSHDSTLKTPSRSTGKSPASQQQLEMDWVMEDEANAHKAKIARELSDIVVYVQVCSCCHLCIYLLYFCRSFRISNSNILEISFAELFLYIVDTYYNFCIKI